MVPEELPGGYEHAGVSALSLADGQGDGQPLQAVYSDGLYAVSTFQQPGRLDWGSLPPEAERVEALGWPAYHWPGAVPARLVWEAADRTFLLVGDAPDDEFHAITRAAASAALGGGAAAWPRSPQAVDLAVRPFCDGYGWFSAWECPQTGRQEPVDGDRP
ncbi:MAG: hypothetical protein ACRDYX_09805 [Egibacteraceae bacterium]